MLDNVGGVDVRKKNVRRTAAERAAIVAESYEPGATVAMVAQRHGIVASQLSTWRRAAKRKGGEDIVVLRAKRGDRIKVLLWDGSGLVLCYKRLEQGKFAWPKVQDGMMRLTQGQFEALFEGLDWRRVMARRSRRPGATE